MMAGSAVSGLRAAPAADRHKYRNKRDETTNHDDRGNYTAAAWSVPAVAVASRSLEGEFPEELARKVVEAGGDG